MKKYDAIVIGAGHNGHRQRGVSRARRAWMSSLVEKNDYIGGASRSAAMLHEDWIYSNCSYVCSLLRPEIYRSTGPGQVWPAGRPLRRLRQHDCVTATYFGGFVDGDASAAPRWPAHSLRDGGCRRIATGVTSSRQCRYHPAVPACARAPDPTSFKPA